MRADIEATPDFPEPEPPGENEASITELHRVIGDVMMRNDELNMMLGFALGQLVRNGIRPEPMLLDYLKRRGILT